jgi:hypothetical protein
LAVVPVSDGNRKMCSLCHRSLPFWFSHESVGGERFESQSAARVPSPHLFQRHVTS